MLMMRVALVWGKGGDERAVSYDATGETWRRGKGGLCPSIFAVFFQLKKPTVEVTRFAFPSIPLAADSM